MASHIGTDLTKVVNEIEKLEVVLPAGTTITSKDVEEHIGISKDFNVFELQNAIGKKDVYRANLIINHMGKNPKTKSIIPMITTLYSFFTKVFMAHYATDPSNNGVAALLGIRPFFVNDYLVAKRNYGKAKCAHIIGLLREYDAKSKGIDSPPVDDMELMREMVYKIIH
jgi:DNA polymerase-3 subunit delta